jgi:hypothetical protein
VVVVLVGHRLVVLVVLVVLGRWLTERFRLLVVLVVEQHLLVAVAGVLKPPVELVVPQVQLVRRVPLVQQMLVVTRRQRQQVVLRRVQVPVELVVRVVVATAEISLQTVLTVVVVVVVASVVAVVVALAPTTVALVVVAVVVVLLLVQARYKQRALV